jgi:prepilin-type N-terminal cleavage/methylation domain-containing protein
MLAGRAVQLRSRPADVLDDGGFTLVELLITVVILLVIMVPLGGVLVSFLHNTTATSNRFVESHDAQIAAAYFAQDVQSIGVRDWSAAPYPLKQSVELNAPPTSGLYPCGSAGTPSATIRMAWDDPVGASETRVIIVSYVLEPAVPTVGDPVGVLHRLQCLAGSPVPTSDVVVAHNVVDASVASGLPGTPTQVTLVLTIKAPNDSGPPLVVTLVGQRRDT